MSVIDNHFQRWPVIRRVRRWPGALWIQVLLFIYAFQTCMFSPLIRLLHRGSENEKRCRVYLTLYIILI